MTPLDTAYPQHLNMPPVSEMGYPMKPQQPNVQFGHMPHTDHMLRGAPPTGAMSLNGPNIEHHERQAPQYDYSSPPQHMQQQHPQMQQQHPQMQHPQQHPQMQHPQQHPQMQHPQQHPQMQHPQQHPQMQHPQQHPQMQHPQMQQQQNNFNNRNLRQQQRLTQQTGPAPVAAEVITKTKTGMSTNKILLVVLVSLIFVGLGVGIVVICKKNKKPAFDAADTSGAVFKPSLF